MLSLVSLGQPTNTAIELTKPPRLSATEEAGRLTYGLSRTLCALQSGLHFGRDRRDRRHQETPPHVISSGSRSDEHARTVHQGVRNREGKQPAQSQIQTSAS